MGETKRITIRIDKEQKDEWKDKVEETARWKDVTHLIFDGVQTVLAEERGEVKVVPADEERGTGDEVDVNLGPIEDELASLRAEVEDIGSDVRDVKTITSYMVNTETEGEGADITTDVYEVIPKVESDQEMRVRLSDVDTDQFAEPDMKRAEEYGCVNDITAALGYSSGHVADAVDALVSDVRSIHQTTSGDHRFVYEVDE